MNATEHSAADWSSALPTAAREVEDFLSESGWDQPPQLFALVPTAQLLQAEPGLAARLAVAEGLTPVAQDPLTDEDVAEKLAEICWPDGVTGCALAQEIVVLPPAAEAELDQAVAGASGSPDDLDRVAVRVAQRHPDRRDARLVVAVLRAGGHCCLLRVRGTGDQPDELVEHPDLAPNMVNALLRTLDVGESV
ncbi:MAG TPA: PPA1309 family protein [Pseudonocardia sp.]|nr:PPA1309 family protein [Pseudonocardia sp.]